MKVGNGSLRFIYSLRFKLFSIFIISILVPVILIMLVFLFSYRQQTLRESNILISNTLTSISQNISSYLYELQTIAEMAYFDNNVMSAFENGRNNLNPAVSKARSSALLAYLEKSNRNILSIVIIDNNGSVLYANRNINIRLIDNYPFLDQEWYKEAIKKDEFRVFLGNHQPEYFTFSSIKRVFSIVEAFHYPSLHKKPAVIMADADTDIFHDMLANLKFNDSSMSLILDGNGEVIYSTGPVSNNILKQLKSNSKSIKDSKDTYDVFSENIIPPNWKIVVLVSNSEMRKKLKWIINFGLLFAFLVIAFTSLIFTVLSKRIIGSFKEMTAVMKQIKMGNLDVKCSVKGNDEIAALKKSLNSMITKLNEFITKEYRMVLNLRNAEYKALQSQIQPHFLYNTLNGFIGLNRLGERAKLEKSILNLTGMMRYTLDSEDMATIEQEFDFLNKYCELQKLRFENRMNVSISYNEAIKDFKIPKLLLQPLVENFILHVVEPSDQQNNISITAEKVNRDDNSYINIRIDDDGCGYDPSKPSEKKSIGITNAQERLKLTYPNSSFIINTAPNRGTHINIRIGIEGGNLG